MPQTTPHGHGLGYRRDTHDDRDYRFSVPAHYTRQLPASVDVRSQLPGVVPFDQGPLGSCVANAAMAAMLYDQRRQGEAVTLLSRLMMYYNARSVEGTTRQDAGTSIRVLVKTLVKQGACPESEWPYTISAYKKRPPRKCYTDAQRYEALTYQRVTQTLTDMQGALASGYPFLIGISVYTSFESDTAASTGVIPMPAQGEQKLGGHCVLCTGYSDEKQQFQFLNSWSAQWGDHGFGYLPYSYLTDASLAGDFWLITSVK